MRATYRPSILTILIAAAPTRGHAQQAAPGGPPPVRAGFALIDSSGTRIGQVSATQEPDGVVVLVVASLLSPGQHDMHLHTEPICAPPGFTTAGSRRNPSLPGLEVNARGDGHAQFTIPEVTLTPGARSIGVPGTSLVLYATEGDDRTDPSGGPGSRVACAAISVATP
jgi:Cu-Zn family superoxide dismutase